VSHSEHVRLQNSNSKGRPGPRGRVFPFHPMLVARRHRFNRHADHRYTMRIGSTRSQSPLNNNRKVTIAVPPAAAQSETSRTSVDALVAPRRGKVNGTPSWR